MGVIVQEYGPIYGEAANGTVQGRPNGSVYVPSTNTIELGITAANRYVKNANATTIALCKSTGVNASYNVTAVAQDLASNVQIQLFDDAECTNLIGYANASAGNFNLWYSFFTSSETIVDGTTYYVRAQLMNNSVPVATSAVISVTGVEVE